MNRVSRFAVDLKPLEDLEPYFRSRVYLEGELIFDVLPAVNGEDS